MEDLIERLEAAEGPDRTLDAHIACAISGYTMHEDGDPGKGVFAVWTGEPGKSICHYCSSWPSYTASIDAALTLFAERPETISTDPRKACITALRARNGGK